MDLTAGVMLSKDTARWTLHGAVHTFVEKLTPGGTNGLCEPSLVELENGEVLMILRSGDTFPLREPEPRWRTDVVGAGAQFPTRPQHSDRAVAARTESERDHRRMEQLTVDTVPVEHGDLF
jgi:hypothetical protein